MSSIYIEVGQCGCQIGDKINKRLQNCYYSTRIHTPNKIHALMIDTEPKVLKPFIDNPPKWLDPGNVKYFQYGRGNNWSYGYMHELPVSQREGDLQILSKHKQFSHLSKFGSEEAEVSEFEQKVLIDKYIKENKEICAYTLDRVRKELEHTDCPMAINVICSLGGGTGSGLGTKIIEKIYQEFSLDIIAHAVLPNKSGETPLQVYNCALSLASLQQHTTAICPIENDKMMSMFLGRDEPSDIPVPKEKNDLEKMNSGIADNMARLFKINQAQGFGYFYNSLVSECVISPQMNYVSLFGSSCPAKLSNKIGTSFDNCISQLCNFIKVYNEDPMIFHEIESRREKCLANKLVLSMADKNEQLQSHHLKKIRSLINPIDINPEINVEQIYVGKKEEAVNESMLLMNHSNILRYLEYLSQSGRKKYEAKAYLWHYRYADLPGAFQVLNSTIDQYLYTAHQ